MALKKTRTALVLLAGLAVVGCSDVVAQFERPTIEQFCRDTYRNDWRVQAECIVHPARFMDEHDIKPTERGRLRWLAETDESAHAVE